MRGTDDMSTEDVLEYFGKYGPAAIEWIDDTSCNVVWNDRISAARALFFLSKPIKGMPIEGPCDPFLKELNNETTSTENKEESGRSILLKNKDREIELRDDTEDSNIEEGCANISDISIPIPPGYWRLGIECDKSKCILLRFTFKSDRKPHRAEKFSEYYKKYGNPNYGGLKGLISETHKKKFRGIFDRNKEIPEATLDPKNPWGDLAMHWHEDLKYTEVVVPVQPVAVSKGKSDIMSRLGFKRAVERDKEDEEVPEKKTKVPRMRMYADEEEEKIKRKKQLQKLKLASEKSMENNVDDLRNILNIQSRKPSKIEQKEEDEIINADLATRLKNRNRRANSNPRVIQSKSSDEEAEIPKHKELSHKRDHKHYYKERSRRQGSYDKYERKLYSDRYKNKPRATSYRKHDYSPPRHSPEPEFDWVRPKGTRSKIAVVIKKQKAPAVASTVWSRANTDRGRLKTVSEYKLRRRRSSSSESSDSSSSSSSSSSSNSSDSDGEDADYPKPIKSEKNAESDLLIGDVKTENFSEHKNLLRIEINNDHFVKK